MSATAEGEAGETSTGNSVSAQQGNSPARYTIDQLLSLSQISALASEDHLKQEASDGLNPNRKPSSLTGDGKAHEFSESEPLNSTEDNGPCDSYKSENSILNLEHNLSISKDTPDDDGPGSMHKEVLEKKVKKKKKKSSGKNRKPPASGFEEYYADAPMTPDQYQEEVDDIYHQ